MFLPQKEHTCGPTEPVPGITLHFYVDNVRTLQKTQVVTVCYNDSFPFFYVGDIRASQETHLWT
jgi:hypothetical protein